MRITLLAMGWTGFNEAALRELVALGHELQVVTPATSPDTAFTLDDARGFAQFHEYAGDPVADDIIGAVTAFAPDVVLMHSWHVKAYRATLDVLPAGTLRVLWMDNVWRNVPKQWVGRAVSRWYVRPLFDAVMVPSDRTEFFARRLGFEEGDVIRGSLSADTHLFGSPPVPGDELARRASFVACLRLVDHKGADVLADAYRRYRARTGAPWSLQLIGIGPMETHFEGLDGVVRHGFQPPARVAELMRASSCLVVPSRIDPFGVVVHEGALSALPIVSTYLVGAAPAYVQDGQNGWMVASGDAEALAVAMQHLSELDADELGRMSQVSRSLAERTSSAGWARNLDRQLTWRRDALLAASD